MSGSRRWDEIRAPGVWALAPNLQMVKESDTAVSATHADGGSHTASPEDKAKLNLLRRPTESPTAETPEFRITLTLSVEDAGSLWDAAAARARQAIDDADDADLEEMLGPREDPALADCIAMLASPAALDGCALQDFAVDEADRDGSFPMVGASRRSAITLLKR